MSRSIEFFEQIEMPTTTAQQRRWTKTGKTYQTDENKAAKALFKAVMEKHSPEQTFLGPLEVELSMTWGKVEKPQEGGKEREKTMFWPKTTKPDLDNAAKLILDAMTLAGFWKDDAQVAVLHLSKFHGAFPGLAVRVTSLDD